MARFKVGQVVASTKDKGSTDWKDNDRARRRPWGAVGEVLKVHDSHGLVYDVLVYEHGREYYEHEELEAV